MKIESTFEKTYPLYPFAPLVTLGIVLAEALAGLLRHRGGHGHGDAAGHVGHPAAPHTPRLAA